MVTSLAAVFSPMPGTPGEVVARVAAERGVLGVLRRRDAGALEDAGLVVEHVVGDAAPVVEHLDVRVGDELVAVAVAGDDDTSMPSAAARVASVAMTSSASTPDSCSVGMSQRVEHLVDQRDLRHEQVGRLLAVRPCTSSSSSWRNVRPGASNTTAMSSGCSSPSTFTSIDVNP